MKAGILILGIMLVLLSSSWAASFALQGSTALTPLQTQAAIFNAGNLSADITSNTFKSALITPTLKVFALANGTAYLQRQVDNNVASDTFEDCGLFVCDIHITLTPEVNMVLGPNSLGGGALGLGNSSVNQSQIFFYSNSTTETDSPTYAAPTTQYILGNGTIIYNALVQNGTTPTYQTQLIRNSSISGLQLLAGQSYEFYVEFTRSNPAQSVDIYDSTMGNANTELAIWPGAQYYYMLVINSSVSTAESNLTYRFNVNTSNGTIWNSTGCLNYVISNFSNTTAIPSDMAFNTTSCGSSSSNLSIFFNSTLLASSSNNTFYLWVLPLNQANQTPTTLVWQAANYTGIYFPGESTANPWIDHSGHANLSLNGSVGRLVNGSFYPLGLSFGNTSNSDLYNISAFPYLQGSGTGGFIIRYNRQKTAATEGYYLGMGNLAGGGSQWGMTDNGGSLDCFTGNDRASITSGNGPNTTRCDSGQTTGQNLSMNGTLTASSTWTSKNIVSNFFGIGGTASNSANSTIESVWLYNTSENASTTAGANYVKLIDNSTVNSNYTLAGPFSINNANPSLTPSPSYYPTTVQGFENDSNNILNTSAINWTLYVNGSNYTSGSLTNGSLGFPPQNLSLFNLSLFTYNSNLTLYVWENYTSGSATVLNSSNLTISKSPIVLNISLTPATGSAFTNSTLNLSINLTDNDTYAPYQPVNVSISWLRNGVNQTSLFTTLNLTNNTINWTSYTPVGGFTIGDNWTAEVFANDMATTTGPQNSTNTTIGDYLMNATLNSTQQEYDLFTYSHFLNFTMAPGLTFNQVNASIGSGIFQAICGSSGQNINCTDIIQPSFTNSFYNTTINWSVYVFLANGSLYSENFSSNLIYNITVNASGLYPCNASLATVALNYTFWDATNGSAVNATLTSLYNMTSQNGSIKVVNFSGNNLTLFVCMAPSSKTFTAILSDTANASGYQPAMVQRTLTISSVMQNLTIYLQEINQTNATQISITNYPTIPVSGVLLSIYKFTAPSNYTLFQTCISASDGTCLVYLVPNTIYYQYNFSYAGQNYSFGPQVVACTPGSTLCYQNLVINSINLPYYLSGNFSGSCTFSNSTLILTCTGKDLGNVLTSFLLQGNSPTVQYLCSNSSAGSSATLTCTFPNVNGTYSFNFIGQDVNGNTYPLSGGTFKIGGTINTFGASGWLALLLLVGVIAMAGAVSPSLSIALTIMALLFGGLLGFVPLITIPLAVIGTVAGIVMWRLKV